MAKVRRNKILTGVAGEYYVAAELSRLGYVATLTLRNTRGIDILVSNADATKSVGIQVKTHHGKRSQWLLSEKVEKDIAENLFYVFVKLNGSDAPEYYVVPRGVVATTIKKQHEEWLKVPGKHGNKHNATSMRKFRDPDKKYLNAWNSLGL